MGIEKNVQKALYKTAMVAGLTLSMGSCTGCIVYGELTGPSREYSGGKLVEDYNHDLSSEELVVYGGLTLLGLTGLFGARLADHKKEKLEQKRNK